MPLALTQRKCWRNEGYLDGNWRRNKLAAGHDSDNAGRIDGRVVKEGEQRSVHASADGWEGQARVGWILQGRRRLCTSLQGAAQDKPMVTSRAGTNRFGLESESESVMTSSCTDLGYFVVVLC